jgi:hypothetical protein
MAPVLKTGIPERVSGVRIPPSPPVLSWSLIEAGPNTIVLRRYGANAKLKNLVFYVGDPDAAYRYVQDASPEQDPKKVARPIPFVDGPPDSGRSEADYRRNTDTRLVSFT